MDQSTFERQNSELLAVLQACGIETPYIDSDKGQAIAILQSIIDEHHSLDDVEEFIFPEFQEWINLQIESIKDLYNIEDYQEAEKEAFQEWQEENQATFSEVLEALETLESKLGEDDFYFEFDGNEYRLIEDSAIWEISRDEIQRIVEECYELNLDKVPSFVALSIDWEQTAANAFVDGYAHNFSSYDGETDIEVGGYHVFYIN